MLENILLTLFGLILLYAGAEGLVRGSSSLARNLGLSPLVIGLTVVAFGTSLPELVVSSTASWSGNEGIAVGNVVGSNIANVALILGVAAVIYPLSVHFRVLRIDLPLLVAVSIAAAFSLMFGVSRWLGIVFLAGLIVNVWINIRSTQNLPVEASVDVSPVLKSRLTEITFIAIGLGCLVAGGHFFTSGSVSIARYFEVSETVIGLTLVALGTSLPELATSAVAALRKEVDMAVGNVIGSNLFNILGILGTAAVIHPIPGGVLDDLDLWIMVLLTIILLPLIKSGMKISRWEGAGLILLYIFYVGYIAF